ncbi:MAG: hypothetical protein WDN45_10870 [Caulobacteraceae bacterium]
MAGVFAVAVMLADRKPGLETAVFLCFTILTSATGFLFHSAKIGPPHIVGALSLVVLAIACAALYGFKLKGVWRPVYVSTALLALYFNAFVGRGAGLRQDRPAQGPGADRLGAAVPGGPAGGPGGVRRARRAGDQALPSDAGAARLTALIAGP